MLGHRRTEGCCFSVILLKDILQNNDTCTDEGGPFFFDLHSLTSYSGRALKDSETFVARHIRPAT